MGVIYKPGFTIIETMLFLALTGVMVAGILVGTGTSINTQRYRDSVSTLKSTLAQQYSEVSNTRNVERGADVACDSSANVTNVGVTLPRGQADCILIGRYLTIDETVVSASAVVGRTSSASTSGTDIQNLQTYELTALASTTENTEIEWGASIAWPSSGSGSRSPTTPRQLTMLILQSPKSGLVYTFTSDGITTNLKSMVIAGNTIPGQAQRRICVEPNGVIGRGSAVFIQAFASGPNAVEVRTNDMGDASTC